MAVATAQRVYADTVTLGDEFTLGTVDALVDMLREHGSANLKGRLLSFEFEADDDWGLCEIAHEVEQNLGSWGVQYVISRNNIRDIS